MSSDFAAQIRDHLSGVRQVLLDVFDTLILRTVEPEHVKRIVSRGMSEYWGLSLGAEGVYQLRQRLERRLCRRSEADGGDLEFRLEELFGAMYLELRSSEGAVRSLTAESFTQTALQIEYETERHVQYADPAMLALIEELRRLGIPASAVTDSYLPRELLGKLLEGHGLLPRLDRLFISSEFMETKRSGRLYDRILTDLGVDPQQVLIIGDNEYSDIERARSRNIKAFHVDRTAESVRYRAFAKVHATPATVEAEIVGLLADQGLFSEMAVSLYAFIWRLHTSLVARGARDVFFLSREGEFLRELFGLYQQACGYSEGSSSYVRSHYLMVSRKSTFIPSLGPVDKEMFETLFRQYRQLSLYEFLHSLNFPDESIRAIAAELACDAERTEADFPTSDAFARLRRCARFRDHYETIRREQRAMFFRYLAGFDVDLQRGLHLVDVGWKGTIQDHIFSILDGKQPVSGYYLGLVDYAHASPLNQKQAMLFDTIRARGRWDLVYNCNRAIFEVFTGASHGSVREYREADGAVVALTDDKEMEASLYRGTIRPVQERLLGIFKRLAGVLSASAFDWEALEVCFARMHFRLGYLPLWEEREFFRNLHHFENFGMLRQSSFQSGPAVSLPKRATNLCRLLWDPRKTLAPGWWAPLTLDSMGLSFLVRPYGRLMRRRFFGGRGDGERESRRHRESLVLELKEGIENQSRMISERDAYIKRLEQLSAERMEAVNRQSHMLDERDAQIRKLEQLVNEKDEAIRRHSRTIEQHEPSTPDVHEHLGGATADVATRNAQ